MLPNYEGMGVEIFKKNKKLTDKERENKKLVEKFTRRAHAQGDFDPDLNKTPLERMSFITAVPFAICAGVYFILKQAVNLVLAIVYVIYSLFFAVISHALGALTVLIVIAGGIYFYTEYKSEITEQASVVAGSFMGKESLETIFSAEEMSSYYIPQELSPIMPVKQNILAIERYKQLIISGEIGSHGEGAVSLLTGALKSGNEELRSAAYEALTKIGTPEATRAIESVGGF